MQVSSQQIKAIQRVLLIGGLIMLIKFVAFFITHSNSILSDSLESVINITAGLFAWFSLHLAAKPKDINHPYGHGKIEFFSAGFEGSLIFLTGLVIIGKATYNLIAPAAIHNLDTGAILAGIAGTTNFFLGKYLIKTGKKHNSITLIADGKHLQSDTWSSLGLVVGVVLIYFTKIVWLDNVFAILFGFIIIYTGYPLMRKAYGGLMDEADEEILQDVIRVLNENKQPQWIDVHNLRLVQYGSNYHIDCHLTLPWYNDLQKSHAELKKIETLISKKFNQKVEVFIHPDPCVEASCEICSVKNCSFRKHPYVRSVEWTIQNVSSDKKHQLNKEH
ncbi:MAG: cation diffusion facilitator family transporter [Bacteroidia bacterium]|nr:cation diffusion facilitator family transporter [Bacteroidia bacterium]